MRDYKNLFVATLNYKFGVQVDQMKIGYESYYVDTGEVDERYFEGFCIEDYT